jgi:hypothetical protein
MERILASERRREKLRALMDGRNEVENGCSELVRLAARLIIEEALEGEARDALGREYYARGAVPCAGCRNGYRKGCVRSAEGAIEYGRRRSPIVPSLFARAFGRWCGAAGAETLSPVMQIRLCALCREWQHFHIIHGGET